MDKNNTCHVFVKTDQSCRSARTERKSNFVKSAAFSEIMGFNTGGKGDFFEHFICLPDIKLLKHNILVLFTFSPCA